MPDTLAVAAPLLLLKTTSWTVPCSSKYSCMSSDVKLCGRPVSSNRNKVMCLIACRARNNCLLIDRYREHQYPTQSLHVFLAPSLYYNIVHVHTYIHTYIHT